MKRSEALKHFKEEYVDTAIIELNDNIEKHINKHKKRIDGSFCRELPYTVQKDKRNAERRQKGKDSIYNLFL